MTYSRLLIPLGINVIFIARNAIGFLLPVHVHCYVMFSKFFRISICNRADAIGSVLCKALSLEVNTSLKLVVKVIIWHGEILLYSETIIVLLCPTSNMYIILSISI